MLQAKEDVKVNFMHPTTTAGTYKYPPRPDEDTVELQYVFAGRITPPIPRSGGRLFALPDWKDLQHSYDVYKNAHF